MLDKLKFLEMLTSIVEIAKTQENTLTQEEIKAYFKGMELETEHYDHIYAYLAENRITVKGFLVSPEAHTPSVNSGEEAEATEEAAKKTTKISGKTGTKSSSKKDSKFLKMYLKDLATLTRLSAGQEEVYLKQLISGEESVLRALTDHWLFKVVDIARTFEGKGAILEDLIQEGNMGLLSGLQELLGRKDNIDGAEYLKESIEKAIIDYIDELASGTDWGTTVVAKTNLLSEAAKYLAEEFGRVATIKELSEYTRISEQEIEDILTLSLDAVKTGEGDIGVGKDLSNEEGKGNAMIDWSKKY